MEAVAAEEPIAVPATAAKSFSKSARDKQALPELSLGGEQFCKDTRRAVCPLLANNGLPGHVAGTSAPPPRADIHWPMSVIVLFSSAYPPTSDIPGEAWNVSS
jgi:hypothetical protein